ncbi:hypothetical protein STCU_11608 [Strigomonas culicis]|uniref:Uncharacterized protein n=1 Tax=Strigomonas culicis TaxID=28005 RepID=S9TDD2_9TRYP|nr:hypothetical protein STCU_11608 [Strigomonas culicis]|eukprot:EPY16022.1 hypothetical protein STCU_11608 [Strigomonas culicis]
MSAKAIWAASPVPVACGVRSSKSDRWLRRKWNAFASPSPHPAGTAWAVVPMAPLLSPLTTGSLWHAEVSNLGWCVIQCSIFKSVALTKNLYVLGCSASVGFVAVAIGKLVLPPPAVWGGVYEALSAFATALIDFLFVNFLVYVFTFFFAFFCFFCYGCFLFVCLRQNTVDCTMDKPNDDSFFTFLSFLF